MTLTAPSATVERFGLFASAHKSLRKSRRRHWTADAPLFPSASAYEQPKALPQLLSTRMSSIADLQADPEAMAVLKANIAWSFSGSIPIGFEPLSIRDASMFGGVKPEDVDRIEAEFIKINARRGAYR